MGKTRIEYKELRAPYVPSSVRIIFIADAPPSTGRYFYNKDEATDTLFTSLMSVAGIKDCKSREEGLRRFADAGFLLLDATYEPVTDETREDLIKRDFNDLCELIRTEGKNAPIIVLKRDNAHRWLINELRKNDILVLNDKPLPFPAYHHQNEFVDLGKDIIDKFSADN